MSETFSKYYFSSSLSFTITPREHSSIVTSGTNKKVIPTISQTFPSSTNNCVTIKSSLLFLLLCVHSRFHRKGLMYVSASLQGLKQTHLTFRVWGSRWNPNSRKQLANFLCSVLWWHSKHHSTNIPRFSQTMHSRRIHRRLPNWEVYHWNVQVDVHRRATSPPTGLL